MVRHLSVERTKLGGAEKTKATLLGGFACKALVGYFLVERRIPISYLSRYG